MSDLPLASAFDLSACSEELVIIIMNSDLGAICFVSAKFGPLISLTDFVDLVTYSKPE
jgi:hypothetical protein